MSGDVSHGPDLRPAECSAWFVGVISRDNGGFSFRRRPSPVDYPKCLLSAVQVRRLYGRSLTNLYVWTSLKRLMLSGMGFPSTADRWLSRSLMAPTVLLACMRWDVPAARRVFHDSLCIAPQN
jgi:hypothetical protein